MTVTSGLLCSGGVYTNFFEQALASNRVVSLVLRMFVLGPSSNGSSFVNGVEIIRTLHQCQHGTGGKMDSRRWISVIVFLVFLK